MTFELRTGGFYSYAQEDGSARLFVPGFFDLADPGYPSLPTRRTWTNAVVGLGARVASVTAEDLLAFDGLVPPRAGAPQAVALRDGSLRTAFRPVAAAPLSRGLYPRAQARVLETAFQGDTKKAHVELLPLRLDASRGRLVLARRMLVTVVFDGVVTGETSLGGSTGRSLHLGRQPRPDERLLARFVSRSRGLHAVAWEDLLAATTSGSPDIASSALMLPTSAMRLSRKGTSSPSTSSPGPSASAPDPPSSSSPRARATPTTTRPSSSSPSTPTDSAWGSAPPPAAAPPPPPPSSPSPLCTPRAPSRRTPPTSPPSSRRRTSGSGTGASPWGRP